MPTLIKKFSQLTKMIEPKINEILELVADDVKKEIDQYLKKYYDEYDPAAGKSFKKYFYKRTDQLKNCCKIGTPENVNGKISIKVYLDINSLKYNTPGADPYKTVVSANSGLHGGWNVNTMEQIPWSIISNNDGKSYGSGTQIWEEPMRELIDNGKLITIFKKCARQRGLNIK